MAHFAQITPKVTREDLDNLFDAAIQGSDYWTHTLRADRDAEGRMFRMYVSTIDDPENVTAVGEEDVERAIAAILTGEAEVGDYVRRMFVTIFGDDFDVDADGGDVLLQVAALGEVVYG
jgi:hypothetical protein